MPIGMSKQAWFNNLPPSGWTPADLPNLLGWWDASDSSTLFDAVNGGSTPTDNGNVHRWEDKSGNNQHMTQSISTARPFRRVSEINSLDTVEFIGDWMQGPTGSSPLGSTISEFFISFVKRIPTTLVASSSWSLNSSPRIQAHSTWTNGIVYHDVGGTVAGTNRISSSLTTPATAVAQTTRIFGFEYKGSTPSSKIYDNGTQKASSSTIVSSVTSDGQEFRMGGFFVPPSTQYNEYGFIGEMVFSSTILSTDDRQKLEGYFAHKWGLTGNLPGGHPYIDSPPS